MHHKFVIFPFTALVGQETMKKALLINAIDPTVGGVVIKGDKGTGKSTAVRALAHTLPRIRIVEDCPFNCHPENLRLMCKSCQHRFEAGEALPWVDQTMEIVDMPLSATEDMVVGAIDIKRVLKDGIKALEPGILARANRNILYIDEVNLLDDHLINVLLDAAAMGVNIVEREGISLYHPARFMLVGTMNPEEGNLRPQILDRFGLCVEVNALMEKNDRLEIITRRKEFDSDCWLFEERFAADQKSLQHDILKAQALLPDIAVGSDMLEKIVEITSSLGIRTHRADIVMEKTACVIAALAGRRSVAEADIIEAALLALPHRMRQLPFEKPAAVDRQRLEQILQQEPPADEPAPLERTGEVKKKLLDLSGGSDRHGREPTAGNRNRGRYISARTSDSPASIALDATVRRAVRESGTLTVLPEHVMEKVRRSPGEALYIFVLDASSSMRMEKKVRLAKTLSWQLLQQSYEKKARAALIAFRGDAAQVLVEPTRDHGAIDTALDRLPTGGKTPLTHALVQAFDMAGKEKNVPVTVILLSDGKANRFMTGNFEGDLELLPPRKGDTALIIVNAENRHRSIGMLEDMSRSLNALHFYLEELV